ncbi:MAG: FAD-dependent thymidylate synthase [Deltaproteobacteria bacterium]|nr:FAD-dependent thymidylate synthase [Deltaproteobacteria bacterium]
MQVVLAGYSLDHEFVEDMRQGRFDPTNPVSPETLSAAYARISRYPEPVTELRAQARRDVTASRKSNSVIVFGMGHHSVAEHVQINFDILGVSRLALEALEEARLCSYTEKSQRYITLEGDYVVPEEFGAEDRKTLERIAELQVGLYKEALPRLHDHHRSLHPEMEGSKRDRSTVEGWAKEDARYALCLATETQLGFSANARNLEHVIRKLRHHPLVEVRELSAKLYDEAVKVVPSLIILSDPAKFKETFGKEVSDDFLKHGASDLREAAGKVLGPLPSTGFSGERGDVRLVDHSPDPDDEICASLLFSASDRPYDECLAAARGMREDGGRFERFVLGSMERLTAFDPPPRAFETAFFTFEMELSASAFAQLKRHRISTQITQPYDPSLQCTFPDSVLETGLRDAFQEVFTRSAEAYESVGGPAAEYLLTNAHRRRVLLTCNLREVYHLARIRMDAHAQWDIRRLSADVVKLVKQVAPVSARLATGKDTYRALYSEVFD